MRGAESNLMKMSSAILSTLWSFTLLFTASAAEPMSWTDVQNYVENANDPKICPPKRNYLEKGLNLVWKDYYGNGKKSSGNRPVDSTAQIRATCGPGVNSLAEKPLPRFEDFIFSPTTVTARDVACVAVAQKQFGLSGWGFTECKNGKAVLHHTTRGNAWNANEYEPCRSLTNAKLVAQTFKNVAACLGGDSRELFKLFAKESGMILNSTSRTRARGIGQMTQIALLQVQNVDDGLPYGASAAALQLAQTIHENILGTQTRPPKPTCDPLHEFEGRRMTQNNSVDACNILELPDGAFYPTILSMKHYLYYRANIESWAKGQGAEKLFGADYKEILNKVTAYCYSASGYGNTFPTFQALVLAAKKKGKIQKETFLNQLRDRLVARSPRVASEIKTYVSGNGKGLEDRYTAIKKELGGAECFQSK